MTANQDITDDMTERAARRLYELGMGYDIDADPMARESMLQVAREVLTAALGSQKGSQHAS